MKPAISVILLTTLIGAGQGLFLAFYSADWFVLLTILTPPQTDHAGGVAALSFVLLVGGLLASFFHLGHPERAWRAAAMWRTSWLSREVIALPLSMLFVFLYAVVKIGNFDRLLFSLGDVAISLATLIGFFAVLSICALFICTAMIYACLKFLRQWHSPLTVLNFILLGCASGFTLATAIAAYVEDSRFDYFAGMAVFLTAAGLVSRYASLARNRRLRSPSTLQSAIGVHHPNIRQLAQGAMGGSFNTRAFMHDYGRLFLKLTRHGFLLSAFVLPLLLLAIAEPSNLAPYGAAFLLQYLGLLAERWYFFIEAEHPQNIYYQMIS